MARSRLDAADWTLLRSIHVSGGITLADAVERWFAHVVKLGELENERAGDATLQQPTGAEILAARHSWIRAIRTNGLGEAGSVAVPDGFVSSICSGS